MPTTELPENAWDLYQPPAVSTAPPMELPENAWDLYGQGKFPVASPITDKEVPQSILGAVGKALESQPKQMANFMTDPVAQAKALPYLGMAAGMAVPFPGSASIGATGGNILADAALAAYGKSSEMPPVGQQVMQGVGAAAADLVGPLTSFFKTPESLKSAGITAQTLEHMAPSGQNPAEYASAIENQLSKNDVLRTTAKETWDAMNEAKNTAGQKIGDALQKIGSEAAKYGDVENPLVVDAQSSLKPVMEEAQKRGAGLFSKTQNTAEPFQQAYDGLMNIAKNQGGKLGLDNIDAALQETGRMMDEGGEAVHATFSRLYGKLANVRDLMVNTVAQQAKDPELATQLLKNNADYSTYLRLLPSVEKTAYREAIKEGVSAYQKYIGPLGTKLGVAGGTYAGVRAVMDKVLGNQ